MNENVLVRFTSARHTFPLKSEDKELHLQNEEGSGA